MDLDSLKDAEKLNFIIVEEGSQNLIIPFSIVVKSAQMGKVFKGFS